MLILYGLAFPLVLLSFFMPRSRWGYFYHLLVLGIACTEGILGMAMAIPLALFMVRPEVQAYFGWTTELDQLMRPRFTPSGASQVPIS
jgi:hypothetical protein